MHAVVVAGDRPRANVHTFANFGVAKICEVIRLRFFPQADFLCLHEISYVRPFANFASRSQV